MQKESTNQIIVKAPSNITQQDGPLASMYCFSCKQKGKLVYCANCPKQYHLKCINNKTNTSNLNKQKLTCPSCEMRTICPQCESTVSKDQKSKLFSKLVCTVCYRMIHEECHSVCSRIDANLLYDENHPINQIICNKCIMSCGIETLVKNGMTSSGKFWLVHPYYCSKVHIGWFQQDQCHSVLRQQSTKKHNTLVKKHDEKSFTSQCKIDKIIKFYSPTVYKQQQISQIIRHLFNPNKQLQYGSPVNFKFLVKWNQTDTQLATWQDEYLIMKRGKSQLQDYLKYCLYAYNKINIGQIRRSAMSRYEVFVDPQNLQQQKRFIQKNYLLVSRQKTKDILSFTVKFISNIFSLNQQLNPVLIISETPQLWYSYLTSNSLHLRSAYLTGSDSNKKYQIQQQLSLNNHSMFDILVLTYDTLKIELENIKNFNYGMMVFDCDSFYENFNQKLLAPFEKSMKLVLSKTSTNKLIETVNTVNQITSTKKKSNEPNPQVIVSQSIIQLNEQQRLLFMRYVVSFGLNTELPQQILKNLVSFQKSDNIYEMNLETLRGLKAHIKQFMITLLNNDNRNNQKYFWQFDKHTVINRIATLKCLKQAYSYYNMKLSKYPLVSQFQIASIKKNNKIIEVISHAWKNKDDLELMRLILKYGFCKWREICQNFYRDNSSVISKGYEYLIAVLWPDIIHNPGYKQTIERIIQIRSGTLINHKIFENVALIPN